MVPRVQLKFLKLYIYIKTHIVELKKHDVKDLSMYFQFTPRVPLGARTVLQDRAKLSRG